jgi:hypothetical protein
MESFVLVEAKVQFEETGDSQLGDLQLALIGGGVGVATFG